MADFVQTRAAYVAQTSLFGYLKERMGISYPRYFADDVFAVSIRQAQMRIYRACAADLAIFTTAVICAGSQLDNDRAAGLATRCFEYAMKNSGAEPLEDPAPAIEAFHKRAAKTLWPQAAILENAFTESPIELIEAAPVIDEYKKLDSEIVMNSIRFRWRDIREQFRKRVNPAAISEDFLASPEFESRSEAGKTDPLQTSRQD
jgi:hypothetical protein